MVYAAILQAILAISITIVIYFKWSFTYWTRKQLQCIKPRIPFGNSSNYFTNPKPRGQEFLELYQKCRKLGWKHAGIYIFTTPVYLPTDPIYIKNIMAKDFQHFTDRGFYYNEKDQPIAAHLFVLGGTRWRNLRIKLTPTFTSGKIKTMFPLIVDCSNAMIKALEESKLEPVEIKKVCANFTTDAIGTCAFGLDCNSYHNSEIRRAARKTFPNSRLSAITLLFCTAFPNLARALGFCVLNKEAEKFFVKLIEETVSNRETNNLTRKDFLQMLIELRRGNSLTMNELMAQCFVFFFAGFETSSSTMAFSLYEMALNQGIQNKAREEVLEVLERHNGIVSYEAIQEMKYLQQVVEETLRLHPSVPLISRQCSKTYPIPGTEVVIDKGTMVIISVIGLHQDAEYFPEPQVFDPERFNEDNRKKIAEFAFLPFGEGPRMCIGSRFGLMQTKIGLVQLLKNFRFFLNGRTKLPLEMDLGVLPSVVGGVWLDVREMA